MNREIGETVERAITELRQEISQRLRASNDEIQRRLEDLTPSLPASFLSREDFAAAERELGSLSQRGALRDLRDGLTGIDRARSQAEILAALLRESLRYASRAAVLLTRGGEIRGWGSEGFGEAEPAIRSLTLNVQDGPWGRLLQGEGTVHLSAADCAALCSRVESPLPSDGVLVPIVLRDRVAAALYADRQGDGELNAEALQILAYTAAQAIETLPFRERASTATLSLVDEGAAGGDTAQAVAEPVREPESVPAAEEAPAQAAEPEVEAEPEPQAAGAPWAAVAEPAAVAVETELPASSFAETAPTPVVEEGPLATQRTPGAMEEEVPRYPRPVEPEPAAPARFPEASPEATVLLQRSALQQEAEAEPAAPPPQPLRPVAVPEEPAGVSPLSSGTPEVRPPSGVEGPGWAFSTTRVPVSAGDEALHEEARRLARLLVSEIKLYNEEQVEEGRRNRDIYERLKEDIDRSRQMYDERVDPQILRSTDYFYQELVRILAAGDSKALGI
ncbi:MAG TPA: GAF domain-containing protein [Thermoanaerobaculia bacterium]